MISSCEGCVIEGQRRAWRSTASRFGLSFGAFGMRGSAQDRMRRQANGRRAPLSRWITLRPARAGPAAATKQADRARTPSAPTGTGQAARRVGVSVSQALGRAARRARAVQDGQAASLAGSPPRGPRSRRRPSPPREGGWAAYDRRCCGAQDRLANRARSASTTYFHPGHRALDLPKRVIALPLHARQHTPAPACQHSRAVPTPLPVPARFPRLRVKAAARKTGSVCAADSPRAGARHPVAQKGVARYVALTTSRQAVFVVAAADPRACASAAALRRAQMPMTFRDVMWSPLERSIVVGRTKRRREAILVGSFCADLRLSVLYGLIPSLCRDLERGGGDELRRMQPPSRSTRSQAACRRGPCGGRQRS